MSASDTSMLVKPNTFISPGAMALAATGSSDIAEKVSAASAEELVQAGINWAYSPVADINTDPQNPVIGMFRVSMPWK